MDMHLIQLLLPLYTNEKQSFPAEYYSFIKKELTEKFGGLTAYTRSPATGLWKETHDKTIKDDIVIYEVMCQNIDTKWWKVYKNKLEKTFMQEEIIIRASEIELL